TTILKFGGNGSVGHDFVADTRLGDEAHGAGATEIAPVAADGEALVIRQRRATQGALWRRGRLCRACAGERDLDEFQPPRRLSRSKVGASLEFSIATKTRRWAGLGIKPALVAAAMARDGDDRLRSLTLFAAADQLLRGLKLSALNW